MAAKLVVIGDSLSQGFRSGAIFDTANSYPALIANALQWPSMTCPNFSGEGGLPLNLEHIARLVGNHFKPWEIWDFAGIAKYVDDVENYWERGPGSKNDMSTGPLHTNLAVWGFDVVDSVSLSEALCSRVILKTKSENDLLSPPDFPMYRTVRRTLNPHFDHSFSEMTQLDAAEKIAQDNDGIDNLIFWLGANNALGTILKLDEPVVWSTDKDLFVPAHERMCTLWTPEHFRQVFQRATKRLANLSAQNIWFGNVPHLSIPPVARGVSLNQPEQDAEGYFEFYIPCWVRDESFRADPKAFPSFTRDTMKMINCVIDSYNQIIQSTISQYSMNGKSWHLVDMCAMLDSLAFRRNVGRPTYVFPQGLIAAMRRSNSKVADRFDASGRPIIDTRYLCYRPRLNTSEQRYEGGFFSLDGVHPTTIGYGLIAYEFMKAMGNANSIPQSWWDSLVASDALLNDPPGCLEDVMNFLECLGRDGFLKKVLHATAGFAD